MTVNGNANGLDYGFDPSPTPTAVFDPILNFPLNNTGTDIATGLAFEYRDTTSTQTLTAIPKPATLTLFLAGLAGLGFMGRRGRTETAQGLPGKR